MRIIKILIKIKIMNKKYIILLIKKIIKILIMIKMIMKKMKALIIPKKKK